MDIHRRRDAVRLGKRQRLQQEGGREIEHPRTFFSFLDDAEIDRNRFMRPRASNYVIAGTVQCRTFNRSCRSGRRVLAQPLYDVISDLPYPKKRGAEVYAADDDWRERIINENLAVHRERQASRAPSRDRNIGRSLGSIRPIARSGREGKRQSLDQGLFSRLIRQLAEAPLNGAANSSETPRQRNRDSSSIEPTLRCRSQQGARACETRAVSAASIALVSSGDSGSTLEP